MKKKFFIGLFIVAAVGLFIFAHLALRTNSERYQPQQNLHAPIEIPSAGITTYQEVSDFEKPIVAMFYVDWCGYCRRFMPKFGRLAELYGDKYNFVVINCEHAENMELVKDFHIMGFPTLFIMDKKLEHSFSLYMAATEDSDIMREELDNYIKFRNKILNNGWSENPQK